MRTRTLCLLLALLLMLPLAACGKKNKTEPSPTPSPTPTAVFAPAPTQTAAPSPTPTPTPAASASPSAAPTPTFTPIETPAPILRGTPTPAPTPAAVTPTPAAPAASTIPAPSPTPAVPAYAPVITKQPSGEGHYAGESAVFVTHADKWTTLEWTAVSPSGRKVDLKTFRETFPDSTVTGDNDTTLTITNLNIDMNGWRFFCTFTNEDASTATEEARLKVTAVPGTGTNAKGEKVNSSIFYIDQTGTMFYNAGDRTTTFEDHNSNYAVFDSSGKPKFGNYQKEQQDLEDHALLVALGLYP